MSCLDTQNKGRGNKGEIKGKDRQQEQGAIHIDFCLWGKKVWIFNIHTQ